MAEAKNPHFVHDERTKNKTNARLFSLLRRVFREKQHEKPACGHDLNVNHPEIQPQNESSSNWLRFSVGLTRRKG